MTNDEKTKKMVETKGKAAQAAMKRKQTRGKILIACGAIVMVAYFAFAAVVDMEATGFEGFVSGMTYLALMFGWPVLIVLGIVSLLTAKEELNKER